MNKILTIILLVIITSDTLADETFKFIGSFDNVEATETGHCYGEGVSLWQLESKKIIGLLHIAQGLCGDPSCSALEGKIEGEKLTFKTFMPIYNNAYTFEGSITDTKLSGIINNNKTTLKKDSISQNYKNKIEWCASWSKISRCQGVINVCK